MLELKFKLKPLVTNSNLVAATIALKNKSAQYLCSTYLSLYTAMQYLIEGELMGKFILHIVLPILCLSILALAAIGCVNINVPASTTGDKTSQGDKQSVVKELPTIETFSASSESVIEGHSSTLNWSVKNADAVIITPDVGTVSATGTKEVKPSSATIYTIVASNASGMRSKSVAIKIFTVRKLELDLQVIETKKPDLVIQELAINKNSMKNNAAFTFVEIANIGTEFSKATKAGVSFNDKPKIMEYEVIPAIEPGKSWDLVFDFTEIPGFTKVTVTIDPNNTLDELNEKNNSASMVYFP
jgi:subtilase family serine protease